MNNKYLFLLWNRALFSKEKIIKDLENCFTIEKVFYIKWNNDNYDTNLKSLYGHRLGSVKEKVLACGKGDFLFVLVEDKNPTFESKQLYDGENIVNKKIFEKKQLYRKWTAGSNRIHCSNNKEELNHDLVVLFGKEYEQIISSINDYDLVNLDTKTAKGFNDTEDIRKCLELFGNNVYIQKNDCTYVFSYCRKDIEYFLGMDTIKNNNITILGELEGDLPNGTYSLVKGDHSGITDAIINEYASYLRFLATRENLPELVSNAFNKHGLDTNFKPEQTDRKTNISEYLNTIKNEIKYILLKYFNL